MSTPTARGAGTRSGHEERDSPRLGARPRAPLCARSNGSANSQATTLGGIQRGPSRPKPGHSVFKSRSGAGDEARTRDPYLGKVVLYLAFALGAFRLYRTCATHEPTLVTRRAHSTHVTELASRRRRPVLGREAAQTWAVRRDHRRPGQHPLVTPEADQLPDSHGTRVREWGRCSELHEAKALQDGSTVWGGVDLEVAEAPG
jgi:hypothetical protein